MQLYYKNNRDASGFLQTTCEIIKNSYFVEHLQTAASVSNKTPNILRNCQKNVYYPFVFLERHCAAFLTFHTEILQIAFIILSTNIIKGS